MMQGQPVGSPCPCGSGRAFGVCCGPLLSGAQRAATAEALMRSRYCAFCLHDESHLLRTWHPDTRPTGIDFDPQMHWIGLRIVGGSAGGSEDDVGLVEFIARYKLQGRAGRLHERSRFARAGGQWLYLAGDVEPAQSAAPKTGRNAACSCGSGRKYKHCCGR